MGRLLPSYALAAALAWGAAPAGAEPPAAIDLTNFGQPVDRGPGVWDELPVQDVGRRVATAPARLYLAGMIGPSFASVNSPGTADLTSDDTLFAAGGAIGIAFERGNGRLRIEAEGMGRDTYDAPFLVDSGPNDATLLTNNWSVMTNVWRDLMLTERFGVYGGGGIGAGGYILGERLGDELRYADPAATFAWQVGGGLLWEVTDRLTFDVGYRYFHINTNRQPEIDPNQFSASELMFSLRLYEPFRFLRR